eukprot:6478738-Amphidinium_carterae.1
MLFLAGVALAPCLYVSMWHSCMSQTARLHKGMYEINHSLRMALEVDVRKTEWPQNHFDI